MSFVYMIENADQKLYVGITDNLNKRTYYHNTKQGARFTKSETKFKLVFVEEYATIADARKREIQIKKWRRAKKEILIDRYKKGLRTKIDSV